MGISTLHGLDKISIGSSFTLNSVTSARATTEIEALMRRPAGHIANMGRANLSEKPRIIVTTPEIDTVLAAVPLNGLATTADSYLFQKLKSATGTVARATTSHTRHVMSSVLVYWTRISLPHNGEGSIELNIIPIYDGTNAPLVAAGSVALTTTLADSNRYGCGPGAVNGVDWLGGFQSIEITSGVMADEKGSSSEIWTTVANVREVNPIVRLTTTTIAMAGIGASGTALDGTNGLEFFARRIRAADDASSHIYFQCLNGAILVEEESGQGTEDFSVVLRAEPTAASDSVLPLTFATATAIDPGD